MRSGFPCLVLGLWASGVCAAPPPVDSPRPVSRLEVLLGEDSLDPSALRGQPAVLYVWGEWCRACERSTPEMLALAAQYPHARFVFINTDQPPRMARAPLPPNVFDGRVDDAFFGAKAMRGKDFRFSELGLAFGVPAYYVLDAGGFVVLRGNGSRFVPTVGDTLRVLLAR